jgi:hypothetical protein
VGGRDPVEDSSWPGELGLVCGLAFCVSLMFSNIKSGGEGDEGRKISPGENFSVCLVVQCLYKAIHLYDFGGARLHQGFGSKQATDGSQQTTASSLPNFHGCNMDNNNSEGAAIVRQILDNPWWRGGPYDPALYGYYDCITQRPPTTRNDTGAIQTTHQAAARRAISSSVPIRRRMPQASLTVPLRGKMAVPQSST